MNLVKFTTVLVFLLVLIIPALLSLGIHRVPSGYQPPLSDSQSIDEDISVRQVFPAENNNLSGVGLSIKNPYSRNNQNLIFSLYNAQNILLRQVILNGKNIADGNFLVINFDPITNSNNQ